MLPREYLVLGNSQIALGSAGDKLIITSPVKCQVLRLFAVIEGTSAHATAAVISFDGRTLAGSDTGRGDGDVGRLSKTAGVNQQGKYLYEEPATSIIFDEGEQIVVEVTTANGDAVTAVVGLLVRPSAERPANNTNMVSA